MRSMISGSIAAFASSVMPSASTAVSSTCSVAPTLGYGSRTFAPCRPFGRRDADAARELLDDGAEVAQHVEVEVDGTVADAAAAEVGDERLAEAVQQRAAEQDRDAARSPACASMSAKCAVSTADGSRMQLARLDALGDASRRAPRAGRARCARR